MEFFSDEDDEPTEIKYVDPKPDFTAINCFFPGCTVSSPYNLITVNGVHVCIKHESVPEAIVYEPDSFKPDRLGNSLCHALNCRKSAKLRKVYGGLYCKVHLLEIQLGEVPIRTKPGKKRNLEFQEGRSEE